MITQWLPSSKLTSTLPFIGVGRLVSTKNGRCSGSNSSFTRCYKVLYVNYKLYPMISPLLYIHLLTYQRFFLIFPDWHAPGHRRRTVPGFGHQLRQIRSRSRRSRHGPADEGDTDVFGGVFWGHFTNYYAGWWFQPSWKILVNGEGLKIIPYIIWKIKHVPNHQPVWLLPSGYLT